MSKIASVSLRLATDADKHLEAYDNTKLTAINTCPTWGITRYAMHKVLHATGRVIALEAGGAMHEVFAAVRLYQLWKQVSETSPNLGNGFLSFHGVRLFGTEKFSNMLPELMSDEDERTKLHNFCLQALYQSGFYDDPRDRRRTMSNLEEAATLYIDRYDMSRMPIWVRDERDPASDVGIEIAFDIVISFTLVDGTVREYRFTGKLDGVHWRDGDLVCGENKTASRLDEAWTMSFEMASQVTGYCLAASVFTGVPCSKAVVYGLQIPLPKSFDIGGNIMQHVSREDHHFARWFDWFLHTVEMAEQYKDDPINAPKYTHSCNRYFRACSMIPFCVASDEEQQQYLEEMITEEWSPLHDKAGD